MKMISLIKTLDFLGESLTFSINNRKIFQTVAGGFLSLVLYISYFYFFYFFGLDLLFKRNPNSYSQMRFQNDNKLSYLNLSNSEFIFGIRLEDQAVKFINYSQLFYPRLNIENSYFNQALNSFVTEKKQINMKTCDKLKLNKTKNSIYNLNEWLCPDLSNESDLFIGGSWTDNRISILKFEFLLCEDDNENKCKDINNLLSYINDEHSLYISFIYPEVIFDIDNYNNPFEVKFNNFYTIFDGLIGKKNYLYLFNELLEDDPGIFFETKYNMNEIGGRKIEEKLYSRKNPITSNSLGKIDKKSNSVHSVQILYDKYFYLHTRKYMKIQDLLGNVYGFMDLIILIFGLFYSSYCKFRLNTYLFNTLVFIKGEDENIDKKDNFFRVLDKFTDFNLKISDEMDRLKKKKKNFFGFISRKNKDSEDIILDKPIISTCDENQKSKKIRKRLFIKCSQEEDNSKRSSIDLVINSESSIKINNELEHLGENMSWSKSERKNDFEDFTKKITKKSFEGKIENIEKIKIINNPDDNFEKFFKRYEEYKNSIKFNFFDYCTTKINKSSRMKNKYYPLAEKCSDLLTNKLDLFYYLKNFKKQELVDQILFNKIQIETLSFLSNKIHLLDINNEFDMQEKEYNNKLKNEMKNNFRKSIEMDNLNIDGALKEIFFS